MISRSSARARPLHRALAPALAIATALTAPRPAQADGVYVTEAIGVALARDELRPVLGQPLHIRLGVGYRRGPLALEGYTVTALQLERDGAFRGFVGGEPAEGTADLASFGLDLRYVARIDPHLSAYVRGGPLRASGSGALAGYAGYGAGFGGGFQITGRVRVLGFLWTPLFFVKRGPKITGALYLDQGYDLVRLRRAGMPTLDARVGHVSVGFAVGQAF